MKVTGEANKSGEVRIEIGNVMNKGKLNSGDPFLPV